MSLLAAATFRDDLYPNLKVPGSDPLIDDTIAAAEGLIAVIMGWPLPDSGGRVLDSTGYTLYPGPSPTHHRAADVQFRCPWSVTSIHIDPAMAWGSSLELAASGYVIDAREGRIWIKPSATLAGGGAARWSRDPLANKVVIAAGWSTANVPAAIVRAIAVQTRYLFELSEVQGRENVLTRIGRMAPGELEALLAPGVMASLVGYAFPGSIAARAMEAVAVTPGQVTP